MAYMASGVVYVITHLIRPRSATTVIKLQVAFRGLTKIIQRDLNGIARKVDTSNRSWDKFMLTETICSLNRHKDICISSSLSADLQKRLLFWGDCWEKHFDKISIEERSKFDEETLYNGKLEFSIVRSASDLTTVLGILNSIHAKKIEGIQVLWTPQKIGDVLPEERLLKDYTYLKPLLKESDSLEVASVTEIEQSNQRSITEGQDSFAVSSVTEVKQSNQGSITHGQDFVEVANVTDVKQSNQESTKEDQDSKQSTQGSITQSQDSVEVVSVPDIKQSNLESTKEGQDSSRH
uniref:Uncharacterized protein n=1 Tax=Oryza punctata TaxID=4537 RepID=A0A0E0LQQ6_ORYPU